MAAVNPARLVTLDGLRGIAAICVMLFHAGDFSPLPMPGGYLAVDLFLVLSGYVIAHSYGARMDALGPSGFFRLRFIRLYPLYLVGLITGAGILALRVFTGGADWSIGGTLPAVLLLPAIGVAGYLYPLNPPAWSLGFEALVNLIYGLLRGRLTAVLIVAACILSGAEVVRGTLAAGHANLGADWETAQTGLARAVFSFLVGIVLFSALSRRGGTVRRHWLAYAAAFLLLAMLMFGPDQRALWDLTCILVLFPLLVVLGAQVEPGFSAAYRISGDASYALYCIHFPLLQALQSATR
ncbi:MAG: hypothetical protein RL299_2118, partial [Pseudomonadota bacterium]